ncbi:MAG TPA: phasin family protein [Alphaproteobacteria bacterium]|jgi:phasin family protein|nr:phasin family protein [Alphaproteobacteria bacterium]
MAGPTNPFLENDFTKLFSEFKVPGFDMQSLVATQRRNIEAVSHANQLAVEGVQAVMRRQSEILRQMVEESTSSLKDLMAHGAPEAKIAQQTDLVKAAFEKALANLRELTEMVAKSNTEAADVLTKRIGESLTELKTSLQRTK